MSKLEIIDLTWDKIPMFGVGCLKNPKHKGYILKKKWLKERFKEGLKIKMLIVDGKHAGFIEYIPGEFAWRGIDAPGYYVIQCIFIYSKKDKNYGNGSKLLEVVIKDAKAQGLEGVASLVSDNPFIAKRDIFEKNDFTIIESNTGFELAFIKFGKGPDPSFVTNRLPLKDYKGLNLIYSDQCPYVSKNIVELADMARSQGFEPTIIKIETADDARIQPSPYGCFMVIYDGIIKAEHYISKTRFRNILTREV